MGGESCGLICVFVCVCVLMVVGMGCLWVQVKRCGNVCVKFLKAFVCDLVKIFQ